MTHGASHRYQIHVNCLLCGSCSPRSATTVSTLTASSAKIGPTSSLVLGTLKRSISAMGSAFRISGDEVIFTPLYDQWADAAFVYIPLADVQDLIDQYAAYIRHRDREERSS